MGGGCSAKEIQIQLTKTFNFLVLENLTSANDCLLA